MGESQAIPQDQIRRPTFTRIDVKDAVERLEPDRHKREVEYKFSNGRTFRSKTVS